MGTKDLDFFTADFNEDFTAFHGQTLLDQAEYLNEAIRYILSLYLDPRSAAFRDPDRPDPTSVIIIGHSMGGIVARTMLTLPNYQSNSINTVLTMSAPHAYPPISFDAQIVKTYDNINTYWRSAYSQKWANNNPLWHVTLISIAGGSLDTIVPSDYASLESLVPETHGFTVFTTTIPTVWTSTDHAAITWCDQLRKVIVRALYDAVDAGRASQTRPRAERMRVFKKWFLTGMEPNAETSLVRDKPEAMLTVDGDSSHKLVNGERLVLRNLGESGRAKAYLMPIPAQTSSTRQWLTLLSDTRPDQSGGNGLLEVLLCGALPSPAGQSSSMLSINMDLSSDGVGSTKMSCQNASPDTIILPGSKSSTKFPFWRDDEPAIPTMSYIQYSAEQLSSYDFVAIVDKAASPSQGWLIAEFGDTKQSQLASQVSLRQLLTSGLQFEIPSGQPMVTELSIPSIRSSLLAYNLHLSDSKCRQQGELFAPLLRQYISEPYESKFFVNARNVKVSLHGVTPYVPPPMKPKHSDDGLTFQFWIDPTCESATTLHLSIDLLGSLGKLYMRYRAVFGAFPLLVAALVLRKQFRVYDKTGVFIPFTESLDSCLRQSIPLLLLSLTLLSASFGRTDSPQSRRLWASRNQTGAVDFKQNELLLGTSEPIYWILMPMIGVTSIGVCTMLHYMALSLVAILGFLYGRVVAFLPVNKFDDRKRVPQPVFVPSSSKKRLITAGILLLMVSTYIPYQFAYLVACLVQLSTSVRGLRSLSQTQTQATANFYNYAQSLLLLMILVLQINLPTLVVWVRNLAVNWFEPFSSHHNVLSILPFMLLVETMSTGNMIPRVTSRFRHLTSVLLFGISIVAAVYGVSHAYTLHYLVNLVAAWLVAIHTTSDSWSLTDLSAIIGSHHLISWKDRKKP
jgi:GPI inositol-deacylase